MPLPRWTHRILRKYPGAGLGLVISREIVERMSKPVDLKLLFETIERLAGQRDR